MAEISCPFCNMSHELRPFESHTCDCGAEFLADEDCGGNPTGDWTPPQRPATCTRRRMKPFIDGCGCAWCEWIDGEYERQMREPESDEEQNSVSGFTTGYEEQSTITRLTEGPIYVWNGNCGMGPRNTTPAERLTDANGLEWDLVLWCNVETGELERFMKDENGEYVVDGGDIVTEVVRTAAPLRIEW